MICFSSKREFSSSKFIINVQPLIFKQIDHQTKTPSTLFNTISTFIRSLKKVCKVLVLLQNWISKSGQFFCCQLSNFFFSKQQPPATEKMMVQYFTTVCQQSFSFAVPPKSLHFERKASSFQPHFQHYNRPYYFTFKSLFLILESSLSAEARSSSPLARLMSFS